MTSVLTNSYARLRYVNNLSNVLCRGVGGTIIPIQRCRQKLAQQRTYAGVTDVPSGIELEASMAQNLHIQHQLPRIRTQSFPYWRHIGLWKDVSEEEFLSYRWQASYPNTFRALSG